MTGPYLLGEAYAFPPPSCASSDGLVAVGGDLHPERLLNAYASGIFPWPHEDLPLLWFSPDPRVVLPPALLHVPRSLAKTVRRRPYRITLDTAFSQVIQSCSSIRRRHEDGTWISPPMIDAYVQLHRLGIAHSVEAWQNDELVGGLYGVSLGRAFFGESMFAHKPDASKVAFVSLVHQLAVWQFHFIDGQVHTEHFARFGAVPWSRDHFLSSLRAALRFPTRVGPWSFDPSFL